MAVVARAMSHERMGLRPCASGTCGSRMSSVRGLMGVGRALTWAERLGRARGVYEKGHFAENVVANLDRRLKLKILHESTWQRVWPPAARPQG